MLAGQTEATSGVRAAVEFCCRKGDLDFRFTPSPSGAQGLEGHQRLQNRRASSYLAEFPVSETFQCNGIVLTLRGRADGFDPVANVVEEIKTCRLAVSDIPATSQTVHLAQAMVYAALISRAENLAELTVRVTYLHIDTLEETRLDQHSSRAELDACLDQLVSDYTSWLDQRARHRYARDQSVAVLQFCHKDFRPGQREMAELTYKCQATGGQLLAEAPTGIGKTSATLFPALKGIQTGSHQQVVYVTAKTSGRAAAEETLGQFVDQGLVVNSLSLTAKDKICFSPGQACQAEECPFAKGYYDRRRAAMTEALQRRVVHRLAIEEIARAHEVCPYQLAAELLPWVDVIIGDYHYIYGLTGLLGGPPEDSPSRAVLVDEAHNLPVRARDMYSAGLRKVDLIASRRQAQGDVKKALNRLNNWFLERNREEWESPDFRVSAELPVSLEDRLQGFTAAVAEAMGEDGTYLPSRPLLLEFFFQCLQLQRVAECFGDDFQLEYERGSGRQSLQLRLVCLDPGRLLGMRHHMMESTVLFSATLSPLHWTASALGLSEAAASCSLASPFSAEQLQVQLDTTVDTRYQQRSRSLPRLVSRIQSWLDEAQGNCLVFFPSYAYMEQFLEAAGLDRLEAGHTWIQQRHQDDGKRDELIELLRNGSNVVAFCILGGVFGEGIDLPGDALSRVVIVGVGLPQFNRNTECLRNYYQSVLGNGFEFAYLYPGMQKVNQALGRVIRKDTDVGRALLIDSRYMQSQYRALLPTHWDISNYL